MCTRNMYMCGCAPEGGVVAQDLLADGDVGEEHELLHQRVRLLQLVHLLVVFVVENWSNAV